MGSVEFWHQFHNKQIHSIVFCFIRFSDDTTGQQPIHHVLGDTTQKDWWCYDDFFNLFFCIWDIPQQEFFINNLVLQFNLNGLLLYSILVLLVVASLLAAILFALFCFVKNELQQMDFMMMKISQFFIFRLRIVNFRYCCSFKLLLLLSTVSFPVIRTLNGILLFDWIRCEIEMNWAFGRGVALGRWSWMNAEWWNTMAVCLHFISFLTHSGC